jgi:hypothetical protein
MTKSQLVYFHIFIFIVFACITKMICFYLLLSIIGSSIVLSPETFLQNALMKPFLIVFLMNAVMAALIFEETKTNDHQVQNEHLISPSSTSISTSKPSTHLVNRIFDEPFIGLIAEYIPFPQSLHLMLNRVTKSHFEKDYFSCWSLIAKIFKIPRPIATYDLIWFAQVAAFKDELSILLPLLLYALVDQRRFPFNAKSIIWFIVSNIGAIDRSCTDTEIIFFELERAILNLQDINFSIDILDNFPQMIHRIEVTSPSHDNFLLFLKALVSHSNFENVYKNLIDNYIKVCTILVDAEIMTDDIILQFNYFVAKSIISNIPNKLFIEVIGKISNIFDILCLGSNFRIFCVLGIKFTCSNWRFMQDIHGRT